MKEIKSIKTELQDIDLGSKDEVKIIPGNVLSRKEKVHNDLVQHFENKYVQKPNEILLSERQLQEEKVARSKRRQLLNSAKKAMTEQDKKGFEQISAVSKNLDFDNKVSKGTLICGAVVSGLAVAGGMIADGVNNIDINAVNVLADGMVGGIAGAGFGAVKGIATCLNNETRVLSKAKNEAMTFIRDKYTAYQEAKLQGMNNAIASQIKEASEDAFEYEINVAKVEDKEVIDEIVDEVEEFKETGDVELVSAEIVESDSELAE